MSNKTAEDVRQAFGYLFRAEIDTLREIVLSLPPNPLIVNIGAGAGTSGLLVLETRSDITLITIDITNESSPLGCLYGERLVIKEAGLWDTWCRRWFQLHGDSKEVGREWNMATCIRYLAKTDATPVIGYIPRLLGDARVDLVFVDGGHEYEECAGDILAWTPHLKPGGFIAVHDYKKEDDWKRKNAMPVTPYIRDTIIKPYPGVDRAVDELLDSNMVDYELTHWVDSLIVFRKRQ